MEILVDLLFRSATEQSGDAAAEQTTRRIVNTLDSDEAASANGSRFETHHAAVIDLRPCERAPLDPPVLFLEHDLRVPSDSLPPWPDLPPMRAPSVHLVHRFQAAHEARQIFQLAPEAVNFLGGTIDLNRFSYRHVAAARIGFSAHLLRATDIERGHAADCNQSAGNINLRGDRSSQRDAQTGPIDHLATKPGPEP